MMRIVATTLLLMLFQLSALAQTIGPGFGQSECFNADWLFSLSDKPEYKNNQTNDKDWRKLCLPHDWSVEGQLSENNASCTGYLPAGIAWYRKHFNYKKDTNRPLAYIYFEGVYNRSEVYLNGQLLGKRPNGYISFLYELTPYLKEGENVLAVRVDHSRIADSRWYTGSGIYRDVYFVRAAKTHLKQWGTTYRLKSLNGTTADVEVDVMAEGPDNALSAKISVVDKNGNTTQKEVTGVRTGGYKLTTNISIANAHLWNIDDPYLYTLKVELMQNGKKVDEMQTAMGLHTLRFDPNTGFELNGKNMKVKGVCLHHDAGVLGAAVPEQVWRRRVRNLKKMGANAIRMSHNVQAPILYDICDELGMLVMDEGSDEWEFPKRKWIKGWNQGEPGFDGTFDFFEEWIDRDVQDMVLRDRNHPCVFLWSVGNEVDYPNDPYSHPVLDGTTINQPMFGGYKPDAPNAERIGIIAKRLAEVIRKNDTSRPVTGALAGVVMSNQTIYPEVIDVVGYNYTENRYAEDHATYPKRVLYGSETSTDYNAWKAVRDNDYIFGQFVWTGMDYLGESGRWPSRGLNTGLLNFGAFPKGRGWFRTSIWSEEPMIYIGTMPNRRPNSQMNRFGGGRRQRGNFFTIDAVDNWNYPDSTQVRVLAYTNCPKAQLLVNGEKVGEVKEYNDTIGGIVWDIPYQKGRIEAQGLDANGKVVATYEIKTDKQPVALEVDDLTNEGLKDHEDATKARLLQLLVKINDEDGDIVSMARNDITCDISGNAELLGMEASNNSDMSDYTDNHQPANRGTILVYVRKLSDTPVTVRFSAEGLKPASITR